MLQNARRRSPSHGLLEHGIRFLPRKEGGIHRLERPLLFLGELLHVLAVKAPQFFSESGATTDDATFLRCSRKTASPWSLVLELTSGR